MSRDYSQIVSEESLLTAQKALEANGFKVVVVDNLTAAHDKVLELIPADSDVFTATSVTLDAAGLSKDLNESGKYVSSRNKFIALYGQPDKALEMRRLGSVSDYAVGSVQAITEDGQVLVASATGSQLPNYAYGATNVIWVAGTQKIVKDLSEAMERLENYVFSLENERAKKAYGNGSVISKLLIYRKDPTQRVTIVLAQEPAGY